MPTRKQSLRTSPCAWAIVLIGALAVGTAFAEEAASGAHGGDAKASAAPAEASGDKSSSKGSGGEGAKGDAQPSHGDDGKGHQSGSTEPSGTAKDAGPSVQTGKDLSNADLHAEPARRLDKGKKPGDNATLQSQSKQGPSRRLSPVPQAPSPVRNAIGVIVPAPNHAEPHDAVHQTPAAPHAPVATTPAVPGSATARLGKPELTNHPTPNPVVTPPAANRGAINGTSITPRNVGPPRIGGPTASATGVNGTTIRARH
jgi:hypothetical protein